MTPVSGISSLPAIAENSAGLSSLAPSADAVPPFTRTSNDGAGRLPRGNVNMAVQSRQSHVSQGEMNALNSMVKNRFAQAIQNLAGKRFQINLRLDDGSTAVMAGDAQRQNIRCAGPGGILEINTGRGGSEAVRGFHKPVDLMNFLLRVNDAQGWETAQAMR